MSSLLTQLLIALLCATLGFIAGALVTVLWSERDKQKPESHDKLPEGLDEKQHEPLARLWRDRETGDLITEVDGTAYVNEKALSKSQKNELKHLAMNWAGWVMGSEAKPEVVKAATESLPPVPAPVKEASAVAPQKLAEPEKGKKGEKVEEAKPKTMVEEIDEIMQNMIKGTPLENRGVRIAQDRLGIVVWIGLDHFEGIDAVKDPGIQAALRKAVSEWESRQELKK